MKKKIIVVLIISVLFLIGIFSVTISTNSFFMTTKYYNDPKTAYNANATYDITYGQTQVQRQMGVLQLESDKSLFIGELTENTFIVAEMNIKNGKYAYNGTVIFYEYNDMFDEKYYNQTQTESGAVRWTVAYNRQDIAKLSDISSVNEYYLSDGSLVFIITF